MRRRCWIKVTLRGKAIVLLLCLLLRRCCTPLLPKHHGYRGLETSIWGISNKKENNHPQQATTATTKENMAMHDHTRANLWHVHHLSPRFTSVLVGHFAASRLRHELLHQRRLGIEPPTPYLRGRGSSAASATAERHRSGK